MTLNPSLAPRWRGCIVCRSVVDLADVNMRLFDAAGNRHVRGVPETVAYLVGTGMTGTPGALKARVMTHRRHTEEYLRTHDAPPPVAPGEMGTVTRLGQSEDATWLSLQQTGMNITREAWALVQERLPEAEFNELVSLVRLGSTIAAKRADLEIRGHIKRQDERMRIASGLADHDRKPG